MTGLLAITNLYPRPGRETIGVFNRQQFSGLAKLGHELFIVAPIAWTDEIRDRRAHRKPVRAYRTAEGIEVRHPRYFFVPGALRHHYGAYFLASIRAETRRLIDAHRPCAILGCWAHPDGWAAARLAAEASLPCIVKVVGSDILVATQSRRRRARIIEALQWADAVVAVSRDLAERVVALGIEPGRVHVVYDGLDTHLFCPGNRDAARAALGLPQNEKLVLFVGNLLSSKGAEVLIEAAARLARSGDPPQFVFIGEGRDGPRLRAMANAQGLGHRVSFLGARPHHTLPNWYRACDLVALPSYSEGVPNVLLEAAACGRPFVATRVGGIPEIDAVCRLVPPGDPAAVASAIAEIIGWGPIVPASIRSWEASALDLASVVEKAVAARTPSRTTAQ